MKVVDVGAATTEYVPSYGAPTPATTTEFPATNPCGEAVVRVTTRERSEAPVTVMPRRISEAPPPPPPAAVPLPAPPPFQPATVDT